MVRFDSCFRIIRTVQVPNLHGFARHWVYRCSGSDNALSFQFILFRNYRIENILPSATSSPLEAFVMILITILIILPEEMNINRLESKVLGSNSIKYLFVSLWSDIFTGLFQSWSIWHSCVMCGGFHPRSPLMATAEGNLWTPLTPSPAQKPNWSSSMM